VPARDIVKNLNQTGDIALSWTEELKRLARKPRRESVSRNLGIITGMTIKTAISIEESLYRQVQKLAEEMNVSRSHVFAAAIRSYLRQRQNRMLLEELNAAYAEPPSTVEKRVQQAWRRRHRRKVASVRCSPSTKGIFTGR
jgi:hypothetical protein